MTTAGRDAHVILKRDDLAVLHEILADLNAERARAETVFATAKLNIESQLARMARRLAEAGDVIADLRKQLDNPPSVAA